MRAAILERAPGGLRIEEIPDARAPRRRNPRQGQRVRRLSHRPACDEGRSGVPDAGGAWATRFPARSPRSVPASPVRRVGTQVVSAFIMPCGFCTPCGAGRDDLCDSFFAMNRLKGTLYDGTTRLRRKDGSPIAMYSMAGLAEYCRRPGDRRVPARRRPAARGVGGARLRHLHRVRRRSPRRRFARRRTHRRRRRRRRRDQHHPDREGVRRVADHRGRRARRQARRGEAARRDRRRQRARRPMPTAACAS